MTYEHTRYQQLLDKVMQVANQNIEFQRIWDEAMQAARAASEEQYAKLDDPYSALGGSAWLKVPATSEFGRWVKWNCLPDPDDFYPDLNESQIWDSWLCSMPTESIAVHEAAAQAAADVLNRHLPSAGISSDSMLD
jgi:hypothetical protein